MSYTTQILNSLYTFPIEMPDNPLRWMNCYVIPGVDGGRNLLIDTCFALPSCREALQLGMEELGIRPEDTDVFLTHFHADHTGNAGWLAQQGARLLIGRTDGELFTHSTDSIARTAERYYHAGLNVPVFEKLFQDNPAYDSRPESDSSLCYLDEGDILEYGGYRFRCILVPGHSPGHMCLYEESQKLLILGDHVLFDVTPHISFWIPGSDILGDYLNSLDKVYSLDVQYALPAHRRLPEMTMQERIDELKAHHELRLHQILEALESYPGSTIYQIASHVSWDLRADSWDDFPLMQQFFAVSETLAHLDHLEAAGKVSVDRSPVDHLYYLI